jgi:hypothetical protein
MSEIEAEKTPLGAVTAEAGSTAESSNNAISGAPHVVAESAAVVDAVTNAETAAASGSNTAVLDGVVPKSKQHESDELTKRLQKLALERQKESKGDRLKVIQNDTTQQHLSSVKTFQELNLPAHLLDALFAMGFDRPSAIQEEALPRILADPPHNLIGQAQSGSGKVRTLSSANFCWELYA